MRSISEWAGDGAINVAGQATIAPLPAARNSRDTATIAVLLFPGFSLLSLSSFLAPFEKANAILERQRFRWVFASKSGISETSSLGVSMPTQFRFADVMPKMTSSPRTEMVVMIADGISQLMPCAELSGAVRLCIRQNIPVVALGTATWLLAEMGALNNTECTIHWEQLAAFSETFNGPKVSDAIYTGDGGIWSCAGETSAFDLAIALLEHTLGTYLTVDVCKRNVSDGARDRTQRQTGWSPWAAYCASDKLPQAVALMEGSLDEPLSLQQIADTLTISRRQLERLFETYLGTSPHKYYLTLRLDRARQLIEATSKPIVDIAVACGFVSATHFSKCFRIQHGRSPQQTRLERMKKVLPAKETRHRSARRIPAARNAP
ncbi:helix-turn-helix domain-containing protein (plasmid) [Rhizobium sp. CB3171]|uniref:GlxA family transcriptional regulator n=1 Tax=Rhizobium sp. CB3171 TaxID=3039157 RepID=UPI0024B17744|nr:helix-turn-helix domain-containing protein [Rhizobium sp. CB3171]WFU05270.1 helix-turn-helix domain-containing protein [Rhizobium sp. CB3171]